MADSVREALDDRVRLRAVVSWVVLFGVLLWVFDEPAVQVGMSLLTAAVLGVVEIFSDVHDLRSEVGSLALGGIGLLSASVLIAFGGAAGLVLALVSGWITLDATQTLRHEGVKSDETDSLDERDGHEVYQEYVLKQVDETLRERTLTRRELFDTLEADDAVIDRALSMLDDRGLLARRGSELRVSSPARPGPLERGVRRLARPLIVEFENENEFGDAAAARSEVDETRPDGDHKCEREPAERH